jgi:hypothetical protein
MPFSAVGLYILLLLVLATSRPLSFLHHYHHQVVVKLQAASIPTCPWVSELSHPVPSVTSFDIISNCVQHRGFFLMKLGHIVFATTLCHFCCCVIRVVLGRLQCAVSAALCLATCLQRLLDMVLKWDGSQQTVRRLNPMPVNTQERMEKHR